MLNRRTAAIRHRKQREERETARELERAAERLASMLGLCPRCHVDPIAGEPHAVDCKEAR